MLVHVCDKFLYQLLLADVHILIMAECHHMSENKCWILLDILTKNKNLSDRKLWVW